MRIRKRQVPFPLSSLSPVPLSDPHLSRSPVVQLQLNNNPPLILSQEDDTAEYFNPPSPSDQQNQPIGVGTSTPPQFFNKETKDCQVVLQKKDERGREGEEEGERSNDTSFFGAKTDTMLNQERSNSLQQGRWCEGERAFPLKKRRGSFERKSNQETSKKMKTKMNKKCLQQNQEVEVGGVSNSNNIGVKKKGRGGALMEGSRCSRVNGRGWRCCQQTLVGYSLCEHHLGKGRLRSMTSVRSRSMATTTKNNKPALTIDRPLSSSEDNKDQKPLALPPNKLIDGEDDDDDDGDEEKPFSKRKAKLGIVKARSMSSLLGQETNGIAVAEDNKLTTHL